MQEILLLYYIVIPTPTLSQQFWRFLEHWQEAFALRSVFSIGGRLDSTNFVKGTQIGQLECIRKIFTKDVFLGIFRNFQNSFQKSFTEHPLENVWNDFFLEKSKF